MDFIARRIQIPCVMYGIYFTPPSPLLHFCLSLSAIACPPIRDTAGIPLIRFPLWSGYQTPTVHVIEGSRQTTLGNIGY